MAQTEPFDSRLKTNFTPLKEKDQWTLAEQTLFFKESKSQSSLEMTLDLNTEKSYK